MTVKTLVQEMDAMDWSEDARALCAHLTKHSRHDERGCVVLIAAAVLLARDETALEVLAAEFRDLVAAVQRELPQDRLPLRIVGGRDV
ncbi:MULTISPECIES: hypothetical protein [unclassified Marinovum]|uniref:hypothetical protein n=1 Tax=unclassified Marinovum TaxID=2647166 RepID=UPI003EDBD8CA